MATSEESFIILGSSPSSSLDFVTNTENKEVIANTDEIEEAIKDLSFEANMALKAQLNLKDCPSPTSMMAASMIITGDKSTQELQKHFGEILDENVVLKEMLRSNNDSMKEQFQLIASCQEDMMKTHSFHKAKFQETKVLVEKLRRENKQLKLDMSHLLDSAGSNSLAGTSEVKSDIEFVSSPGDEPITKLMVQYALVENQLKQAVKDNEILKWQKESLEHMLNVSSKQIDELKIKQSHLQTDSEQIDYYEKTIKSLEDRLSGLVSDMKSSQLKVMELENVKLEAVKHKSATLDIIKVYKDQINSLYNKLMETQKIVFQPVQETLVSADSDLISRAKVYDDSVRQLGGCLNRIIACCSDSYMEASALLESLQDMKAEKVSPDQFRSSLIQVKDLLDKLHTTTMDDVMQVKNSLNVFEGIFKNHAESLQEKERRNATKISGLESFASYLKEREERIKSLEAEVASLKPLAERCEILSAQVEVYKSDFEAEKKSGERTSSERDALLADLKVLQRRNQDLVLELETLRKSPLAQRDLVQNEAASSKVASNTINRSATATTTGNMIYKCPKCLRFSSDKYTAMEEHFDFCLDDM